MPRRAAATSPAPPIRALVFILPAGTYYLTAHRGRRSTRSHRHR